MSLAIFRLFGASFILSMLLILTACAQNSVVQEPKVVNTVAPAKSPSVVEPTPDKSLCAEEPPYDYPTRLKGGYRLVFRTDFEFMYLDLYKDSHMIKELTSFSCGLLHKNLGYIAADFDDTFVLAHSYGSGNPHEVEFFRKSDGANLLTEHNEACWVGADEKNSVFIYSTDCVPEAGDTVTLLNLRDGKQTELGLPKAIFDGNEVLNRIEIGTITKDSVTLNFSDNSGSPIPSSIYKY